MEYFIAHVFRIQLLLFFFTILFFWILEFHITAQKRNIKIFHTILNAKFLFLIIPVQLLLSLVVLYTANWTNVNHRGVLYLLPSSLNSFSFFIIAFIILDFFDYLYHFMMHKTPLFWKFHQVHHSDNDVDISTTLREHPGETFIRVSYSVIIIFIVGASPWILVIKQFIQSFSNIVSHSKIKLPSKLNNIISLVFVTPNTHSIHHHYQLPYTDSNFGDVLMIWDRIFSTFTKMNPSNIIYGVDTHMNIKENNSFKNLITRPFVTSNATKIKSNLHKTIMFLWIMLFLSISTMVNGQTSVKGIVVDEKNQPIPFANLTFTGTNEGTSTDYSGTFLLKSNTNYSKINISNVGYENKTVQLNDKKTIDLKITIKSLTTNLNEVAIITRPKKRLSKKENPATKILENIWKNKKKNGLMLVKYYEYNKYSTTELGLNNMDSLFTKRVLNKGFDTISSKININEDGNKFNVPLELIEKTEKIYGDNNINKTRNDIEGLRQIGMNQKGKIFDKLENTFPEIDVYQNDIVILNKNFVSPISTEGFGTYDYVLADSTYVNNQKQYSIHFFPRENQDFAFSGNFTVVDKSFALTDITMTTPKKMNLNFVRNLEIRKTFTIQNDSIYLPKTNEYNGEFTLLTKNENEKGIYVFKKETFENYIFDKKREPDFYDKQQIQLSANQFDKENLYWQQKQDNRIKFIYTIVNKVNDSKEIKNLTTTIYVISDGYVNLFKGIQTGSIWGTAAKNDVEGFRLRLGFRTYKTDNDLFRLEGFAAYGFKDKLTKYGFEARYLISKKPRLTVSAAYLNDNNQMGLTQFNGVHLIPEPDKGSKALINRGNNYFLSHIQKSMFRLDLEPAKNLHIGLIANHNIINSAAPKLFSLAYFDTPTSSIKTETTDTNTDLYLTYTPGKEVSGFGVDEREGIKLHPSFLFNYRRGYKNLLGGSFNYNRLQILYNNPISLGKFGVFDATLGAGKTFEATPLSILTAISSNQTYFLLPNTFALLDYYEFVADTYVEGHFEQHFNGLLLNRIPLIKELKLRSVLTFRAVYGTISNASKDINRSSIIYKAPTKPYYEYGVGLENIGIGNIKPFRLDFIWRSDFQNFNGPVNPKFGIRIGIKTTF